MASLIWRAAQSLGMTPIIDGGITGCTSRQPVFSCWPCINKLNPLRASSHYQKNTWLGLSVQYQLCRGLTLSVAWRFTGVCSNLLSILVQIVCNIIIDPRKRVGYTQATLTLLAIGLKMDAATKIHTNGFPARSSCCSEEDTSANITIGKHRFLFRVSSYQVLQGAIGGCWQTPDIRIHYVTSDLTRQVFRLAKQQPPDSVLLGPASPAPRYHSSMKRRRRLAVTSSVTESSYMKRSYVQRR